MKRILLLCIVFFALISVSQAEIAPVSVRLPETKAWVGQRLPFFIEIRAPGSFQGAASFDLPQVSGTIIIKIGAPVVSSEEIEDQSWFVQAHEFALFSQKAGPLEVPKFPVRFANKSGFTGPASDVKADFPGMKVTIERPPGSEDVGFLITTESLDISETWTPMPGPVEAGAIFKRIITQRASQLSGMALAPIPGTESDGINVYSEDPVIQDKTERGDFSGQRSDTVTYQMTKAGRFTLPELTYVWWNPKTEKMEKTTLPSVSFDVTAPPSAVDEPGNNTNYLPWLLILFSGIGLGFWQRKRLALWLKKVWLYFYSPERSAAKKLLRACRHNDAHRAFAAWNVWRNTQKPGLHFNSELLSAVLLLERHLFAPKSESSWSGDSLARALGTQVSDRKAKILKKETSVLPNLN